MKFSFKLGWAYGRGPGCTPSNIGNLTTGGSYDYWRCTSGCGAGTTNMNDINYVCTGASIADNWEQGERDFLYNFNGVGPFYVSYVIKCVSLCLYNVRVKLFSHHRNDLYLHTMRDMTMNRLLTKCLQKLSNKLLFF